MTQNFKKNLLNPKVKMSKMGEFQELQPIEGLQISAISADLYSDGRDDLTFFFFLMKELILQQYTQIPKLLQLASIGI
ncbi:MAG: hypothetical protein Ct9H300mP5_4410 [Candidatus Pelagibacterales bacterium]|nr:MAG: hypothetical protein Ct9H300mP5_4410 [Pelagibacterales bacterium]